MSSLVYTQLPIYSARCAATGHTSNSIEYIPSRQWLINWNLFSQAKQCNEHHKHERRTYIVHNTLTGTHVCVSELHETVDCWICGEQRQSRISNIHKFQTNNLWCVCNISPIVSPAGLMRACLSSSLFAPARVDFLNAYGLLLRNINNSSNFVVSLRCALFQMDPKWSWTLSEEWTRLQYEFA